MAQNLRLLAYRKDADGVETSFELDLLAAPNISLNFNFTDIKDPSSKKSSYSQSFKLPFTDRNNDYFQDWNVNTTTLTNGFSTLQEQKAILYVNQVEQFNGALKLNGIYKEARYYDIMLLSNVANLFSSMATKLIKDSFINYSGLNHQFTTNV